MTQCLTCEEIERLLDEGLPEDVARHLAACATCRALADQVRQNNALLHELSTAIGGEPQRELVPGEEFSGLRVMNLIHVGGQGAVYQAVQQTTKRIVALKVLIEGAFAAPAKRRRFEREIELVASLRHPHIVTIHESGVTPQGRHYFVMEYIHGVPLDEFLGSAGAGTPRTSPDRGGAARPSPAEEPPGGWSIADTLRLFVKICEAVSYAHQHGVIHRDLKPSNILIDGAGEPHIVDFGVAKVTLSGPGDGGSPVTMAGEFMGTLAYASPEQLQGDSSLVDVRSDVYSLGVILYEALTGHYPCPLTGRMAEDIRAISDTDPPRPSSWQRRLPWQAGEPRPLRLRIDDELDTIVLKALSKVKERRYQSTHDLALDIDRYLKGEPIDAKRDSTWYVLRKFLRRHKMQAAAGAAAMLVILGAVVVSTTFWSQARTEGRKAERTSTLLRDLLASVNPNMARGRMVTVREVLDDAAVRVEQELADEPEVQATLRTTIGKTYRSLGLYGAAEPHLRAALEIRRQLFGGSDLGVAESLFELGLLLEGRAEYRRAEELYRETLDILRRSLPDDDRRVAVALSQLATIYYAKRDYARAEPMLQESLTLLRQAGREDDESVAVTLGNLGKFFFSRGEYGEAERRLREASAIFTKLGRQEGLGMAHCLLALGRVHRARRESVPALESFEQAGRLFAKLLGDSDPWVTLSMAHVALVTCEDEGSQAAEAEYGEVLERIPPLRARESMASAECLNQAGAIAENRGDYAQAETLYREAVQMYQDLLEQDHPDVAVCKRNLAWLLYQRRKCDEAERLCREALAVQRKFFGDENQEVATTLLHLAWIEHARGQQDAAAELASQALVLRKSLCGEKSLPVAEAMNTLGYLLFTRGAYRESEPLLRQALAMRRELLGGDGGATRTGAERELAQSMNNLGELLAETGAFEEAERLEQDALEMRQDLYGEEHPEVAESLNSLGKLAYRRQAYREAAGYLGRALEMRVRLLGEGQADVVESLNNLGACSLVTGDLSEAESQFRRAVDLGRRGGDSARFHLAVSLANLASVHVVRSDPAGAEPLLEESYAILRQCGDNGPQIEQVVRHLVEVSGALGKGEKVTAYRAILQELGRRGAEEGR
ncbi:MAG: serine/threonine-protein kinase [Planctomycetota bacterium]